MWLFFVVYIGKVKSAYKPMVADQARAYPGFCRLHEAARSISTPLDGMLVHCRVTTSITPWWREAP